MSCHVGFAKVPADWLIPLPAGPDLRQAMVIGTAGFTAALSVVALEERGLTSAHATKGSEIGRDVTFDELEGALDSILKGGMTGRAVVDVGGERDER